MKQRDRAGEVRTRGFEDLECWQLARQLMIECHKIADRFPAHERYDLGRRAERTLDGYIGYVRRQKTGREMFGDKYVPDPSQAPQAPPT